MPRRITMPDLKNDLEDLEDGEIESDEEITPEPASSTLSTVLKEDDAKLPVAVVQTEQHSTLQTQSTLDGFASAEHASAVGSNRPPATSSNPFSNKENARLAAQAAEEFEAAAAAKKRKGNGNSASTNASQKRLRDNSTGNYFYCMLDSVRAC